MSAAILALSKPEEIRFHADERPLVPDGIYEAVYAHHDTSFVFRTPKVFVWFRIVTPGPCFNVMVYRAYRVRQLSGKPKRNGGFTIKRGTEIYADLVRLIGFKTRPDRVSVTILAGRVWSIKTRTVIRDYLQRALPEWDRYSVVDSIIRAETS